MLAELDHNWQASLRLRFSKSKTKTFLSKREHHGPLAVQRPFYPEGDLCHVYVLHPPGGIAGGDRLSIDVDVDDKAEALLTTPGATKIYRTKDNCYSSIKNSFVVDGSLELLPLETIVFNGASSVINTKFELSATAKLAAWDIICLGRPSLGEKFTDGSLKIKLEVRKEGKLLLLDKQSISGDDLMTISGLQGYPVLGTFIIYPQKLDVIEAIRKLDLTGDGYICGVTNIDNLVVIRCLANKTYLLQKIFIDIWRIIRPMVFDRLDCAPRIWAT